MEFEAQEEVNNLFNREAKNFANSINKQIEKKKYYRGYLFESMLTKYVKPVSSSVVLDYGCGVGMISRMIFEKGYTVEAYDPSSANIGIAKGYDLPEERIKFNVLLDQGESLADNHYDAIVCSSVIEFVRDPEALLRHFQRSLKPQGVLLISFANKLSLYRTYAKLRFGKKQHYRFQYNVWMPWYFVNILRKAGFSKLGRIRYFDSVLERWRATNVLNEFSFIGTLGLVITRKKS